MVISAMERIKEEGEVDGILSQAGRGGQGRPL